MSFDFEGTSRFQVVTRLGEGAMGVVYKVYDREQHAKVALKTLRKLDGDGLLRFKREFRAIQGIQHPNLVSLGELIEAGGKWFFTMELIEGTDFNSYVREPSARRRRPRGSGSFATEPTDAAPDPGRRVAEVKLDRLRSSLCQLADGLSALHAAGWVHRDIKPSNVLATQSGRVVLLDFGFVTSVSAQSSERIVGTVAYMSPEQAASSPVGPAADWYAVGVMLYEALTGEPPITGSPLEVLMAKQHRVPRRPSEIVDGVPEDLDQLCFDLLQIAPDRRPSEVEVLRRLDAEPPPRSAPSASFSFGSRLFVGRETEMARLADAYQEHRRGETLAVFVHGESGIGKTALLQRFVRELRQKEIAPLILESRCYERESVPYKAFDGVIDSLSRYLVALPPVEAAMLMPLEISTLARVFPVLRRSEVVTKSIRAQSSSLDPAELRERVFSAIRDMLIRLAGHQPVVIVIDDLQWADRDSMSLLRAVFRPPEAPAVLLLGTIREESQRRMPSGDDIELDGVLDKIQHLYLRGLSGSESVELATNLFKNLAPQLAEQAPNIAAESGGHPLFIDEMIRYGSTVGKAPSSLTLDTALWSRVIALEDSAQQLLELVAVAEMPIRQDVAASAAQMSYADFTKLLALLRVGKLIQTNGARREDELSVFHDRIRKAVLSHLDIERRQHCHERLALALETSGNAAPEALAIHWSGAGFADKAYQFMRAAAEQAESALAFDRAARLYRRCLGLVPADSEEARVIRRSLGSTLANAGRGTEAANVYLTAAKSEPADSTELYARAASELIRSGHIDSGFEVLRQPMQALGVNLPSTPRRALASLLTHRGLIRLRGLRYRERTAADISAQDLARIDFTWGLAVGLGLIDTIRGAEIQSRHLRLALRSGLPDRIARALAVEAAYRFTSGPRGARGAERILASARAIAEDLDQPELLATTMLMGGVGKLLVGEYRKSSSSLLAAEKIFTNDCYGVRWEISTARVLSMWSQWYLGDLVNMRRCLPGYLREARERGELFAATTYLVLFRPLLALAHGDPESARKSADLALSRWSQQGFHFQHYSHLFSQTLVDLYSGDPASAVRRLDDSWDALNGSLLLSVQQSRIEALYFRTSAELALAAETRDKALLRRAQSRVRSIAREHCDWSAGLGQLLQAGVAACRGRRQECVQLLDDAIETLDAHELDLYAAAARFQRGTIARDADGDACMQRALEFMTAQEIANPGRMANALAPGLAGAIPAGDPDSD